MKILIVEDEQQIAHNEQHYLQLEGRDVDVEYDGAKALDRMLHYAYDVIVLDRMLPSYDGKYILTQFRQSKKTPVIMTTAK